MARATTSLPVPVSPTSKTLAGVGATRRTSRATSRMAGDSPTIPGNRPPSSSLSNGSDHLMPGVPPAFRCPLSTVCYLLSALYQAEDGGQISIQAQKPTSQAETERAQSGQHAAGAQQDRGIGLIIFRAAEQFTVSVQGPSLRRQERDKLRVFWHHFPRQHTAADHGQHQHE